MESANGRWLVKRQSVRGGASVPYLRTRNERTKVLWDGQTRREGRLNAGQQAERLTCSQRDYERVNGRGQWDAPVNAADAVLMLDPITKDFSGLDVGTSAEGGRLMCR